MFFLKILKDAYTHSPSWAKAPLASVPPSLILGRHYRSQLKFLESSDSWPAERLLEYQRQRLFELAEFAANTVPYYRELFRELRLPAKLSSMEQFLSIPPIDKETIRRQGEKMLSEAVPARSRYKVTTGGTTGVPLGFWMSSDAYAQEWAFVHNLLARYGILPSDRKIGLRGVSFNQSKQGRFTQINPIYRELQVSPFHLTESIVTQILPEIEYFKPGYIHGYPSSITLFAKVALRGGWGIRLKLKGVLAISETLYPHQHELIEKAFGCPVFTFYGHSERLIFAGTAPHAEGLLVDPRYGLAETIDGELIGTGFLNRAQPLLRYRTGDHARLSKGPAESYGVQAFPRLTEVQGRWRQEMLIGKSGALISVTALNMHSEIFTNVERFQFYQDAPGRAELRIVVSASFQKENDERRIYQAFSNKVGEELDIAIRTVDQIELTPRGKQMFLIQKLKTSI